MDGEADLERWIAGKMGPTDPSPLPGGRHTAQMYYKDRKIAPWFVLSSISLAGYWGCGGRGGWHYHLDTRAWPTPTHPLPHSLRKFHIPLCSPQNWHQASPARIYAEKEIEVANIMLLFRQRAVSLIRPRRYNKWSKRPHTTANSVGQMGTM